MNKVQRYKLWLHPNWPDKERLAWVAANDPGDVLSGSGPATLLAARTRENAELAYGRYVEFLFRTNRQRDVAHIADRLRIDDLRAFAQELGITVASQTVFLIFSSLSRAIRLMDPKADRKLLSKVLRRLGRLSKPTREIDKRLISPIELLEVADQMMKEAEACPVQGKKSAVLARNSVLIKGGALCPLRRKNWLQIVIGKHLRFEGDGGVLSFAGHEMKSKRRFEVSLPSAFAAVLQRYIDYFRPRLLRPGVIDEGVLFPSWHGKPMFPGTMSYSVKSALLARTGKAFSMHMFRYAAATFISDHAPERMVIAKGMLHHRSFRTTSKYYIRGQRRRAMTKYQDAVAQIVKKAKAARNKGAVKNAPKKSRKNS